MNQKLDVDIALLDEHSDQLRTVDSTEQAFTVPQDADNTCIELYHALSNNS